jgi:hypothetical protein
MAVRLAWLLDSLCRKSGYSFASDTYFSETLGIQPNHIQRTLTAMERAGAIIRTRVFVNGRPQRRIWPSVKILPKKAVVNSPNPHNRHVHIPITEGQIQ